MGIAVQVPQPVPLEAPPARPAHPVAPDAGGSTVAPVTPPVAAATTPAPVAPEPVLEMPLPKCLGQSWDVWIACFTLPETNIAPENRPSQKERIVFQPSIFRGKPLVSGRVYQGIHHHSSPPFGRDFFGVVFFVKPLILANRSMETT